MSDSKKPDTDQWVDLYGDMMYRYTLLRVRNPHEAEEIVQSTFLAALSSLASFEGRSSEKSWLFGILKHKILDHFRFLKKNKIYESISPEDGEDPMEAAYDSQNGAWMTPPGSWDLDPPQALENTKLREALNHCLGGLSEKFRHVFVLKEVDGLESDAICKELGIKPTNLWVILHRARNQLKLCLEAKGVHKNKNRSET